MEKGYCENKLEKYLRKSILHNFETIRNDVDVVDKWKKILEKLGTSDDPFETSIKKYKCRMFYYTPWQIFLLNLNAFFKLCKINLIKTYNVVFKKGYIEKLKNSLEYLDKGLQQNGENVADNANKSYDMVIQLRDDLGIEDVFPDDLYKEFPNYIKVDADFNRVYIFHENLKNAYRKLAKRNFWRFNYKLMALKELALHSYILESYNPKATVVYINERNVFGSVLKSVYEKEGREFIGFMHGTDLMHLIKSYMSFSRYYMWDKEYIDMYKNDMNCNIDKYIVYKPKKNDHVFKDKKEYRKDITYYMSGQTPDAEDKLAHIMKELQKKNINMYMRPHPRLGMDEDKFLKGRIEKCDVDIIESIDDSEYVAGVSTTVIEQAYYGGKKVLIDDVSNKNEFKLLKDRKYLMLSKIDNKKVEFFSDYLKEKGIKI